ncbi:SDR family oxidoreductase [Achromobacter sp. ACM04]|uniref:SDR family oxidoreductase n=1 Tax=Achromobacter aegrifaciens TaxID=1287736 RepID=A0ABU2DEE9_ACHAE|nr:MULTISPECIES: SDR family oxidoreductase [Achromobacter]PTN50930.1 short chain dehydrogenase [Achromobacter xylosoxidans]MBD9422898.1 SDR family oxidoreductase [Achromobacter sp. ACM04]MDQ1761191.1 SDR family oxidoreductase [Achromobacter aegrifaciens]MDR7946491.1 SDR family oxidoreductase [Achromobacter aegrifaciens]CAB3879058.1 Aklaviketone reductase DauE [Achromobacter aegrifaciens]
MKINQTSVVLTGAAGGLGSAIARMLRAEGARVLLVGRRAGPTLELAKSLSLDAHDRSAVDALVVDITTQEGRAAIADAAAARRANVLINNAAVAGFGAAGAMDAEQTKQIFDTNAVAPMLLTASLLPVLLGQPRAQVLNIGSVLGSLGVPGFAAYGASKAALRVYTESLRRELADSTVRVQYYAPRAIDTPFNAADVIAFNQATGSPTDSPEAVARAVLRMLEAETAQRYAGPFEALAVRLNSLFPRLLDGAFTKHRRALRSSPPQSGVSS